MVRLVPELKSMVYLILASMTSFIWTCVLLMLLVYMLAVYMVMMAADTLEKTDLSKTNKDDIRTYWGSIGSAVLSLYWSITGGQDWGDLVNPLVEGSGHQIHNLVFSLYIAFSTMVIMNLVTGVFVEGAARLNRDDKDRELARMARKTFHLKEGRSEEMTKSEFDQHIINGDFDTYLEALDLNRDTANDLFELIDTDQNLSVNLSEFVDGCMRLKGIPRAADVSQLLMESRRHQRHERRMLRDMMHATERCNQDVRQFAIGQGPRQSCSGPPVVKDNLGSTLGSDCSKWKEEEEV